MIIVTGQVNIKSDCIEEAMNLCKEHVERSRTEEGCISHHFYADTEDPLSLFFFEEWADQTAINAHFALPASKNFVQRLSLLCQQIPSLNIYNAQKASR